MDKHRKTQISIRNTPKSGASADTSPAAIPFQKRHDVDAASPKKLPAHPPGDRQIHSAMRQSSSRPGPSSERPPSEVFTA